MECGKGNVKETNYKCRLCHGCDHLRGLCPFPKIRGWNGGRNRAEQISTRRKQEATGRTPDKPTNDPTLPLKQDNNPDPASQGAALKTTRNITSHM